MAEQVNELWARVAAGELNAQQLEKELLKLQIKLELLDHRTEDIKIMLADIRRMLDK